MKQFNFPDNVNFFSTPRYLKGGASIDEYANFNLATYTGDRFDAVIHNRQLLVTHFDLPNAPKWLNQTHSNICLNAKSNNCKGDAVITREKGIVCAVITADCLPIFTSNQSGTQIGVAHAGWQGILNNVIESFISQFDERDLLVHFGAAICVKHFEVGKEIFEKFITKNKKLGAAFTQKSGQHYLDIYQAARIILNELGVKKISGGNQCTFEQKQDYFSYRRDGINSGRMAHLIWIKH